MYSTIETVSLDYSAIVLQYSEIINYLFKTSDQFSVVADLKKPYTKVPPNVKQSYFVECLKDYCIDQLTDIKKWPDGVDTNGRHKVLLIFHSCRQSFEIVRKQANVFTACENNLPEDICFFRKGRVWFSTVTHEHIAYVTLDTFQDVEFFRSFRKLK